MPAWAIWQPHEPDRLQPCLYGVRPGPHLGSHAGVPGVRDGYVLAAHLGRDRCDWPGGVHRFPGVDRSGLWHAARRLTAPYLLAFALGAWMIYLNSLAESLASSMYESPPRIWRSAPWPSHSCWHGTRRASSPPPTRRRATRSRPLTRPRRSRRHQPAPARCRAASHHPRAISCRRTSCCRGS